MVIIARGDSIDGALPGESSGGIQMAVEDAWEAADWAADAGKAKQAGTLITNQQLADLGYTLQFSILFNFNTAGLALEKACRSSRRRGWKRWPTCRSRKTPRRVGYPNTKMHQKFAGMNRWLILESVLSQRS